MKSPLRTIRPWEIDPDVTIDADHVYRVRGRIVAGVTSVLQRAGLIDSRWFTPEARERGRIVHKIAELEDRGKLDLSSIDPRLVGYAEAYRKFKRETRFRPFLIEWRFHDRVLDYCGTLDRLGEAFDDEVMLVDLKTGDVEEWVGLQLVGYERGVLAHPKAPDYLAGRGLKVQKYRPIKRRALQLRADATYKLHPFDSPKDMAEWGGFVTSDPWRRRNQ